VLLGYGTYIWLSVAKLLLKCAVVSLYSFVKQRLKFNTGKVCNCLIQLLLTMVYEKRIQHILKVHSDFPNALYKFLKKSSAVCSQTSAIFTLSL
jgi:hypothetical protein